MVLGWRYSMKHLFLPPGSDRRLVFYLAAEEYAARHLGELQHGDGTWKPSRKLPPDSLQPAPEACRRGKVIDRNPGTLVPAGLQGGLFFTWQTAPTVIFGRNQVLEAEVDTAYCREHGVEMYRRKSGGGCVYSDRGNIMLSYIVPIGSSSASSIICQGRNDTEKVSGSYDPTGYSGSVPLSSSPPGNCGTAPSQGVAFVFDKFLSQLSLALRRLGLDARRSGRNDVMIGDRKVSGNAFYLLPGAGIVHGTLLFDSDFDAMNSAITPSKAKIESKGVPSVRQHVTNLKDELEAIGRPMSIDAFIGYLTEFFCTEGSVSLDASQMHEVEEIEKGYLDPAFISGRKHGYSLIREGTVSGVGQLCVEIAMEGERISGCSLSGDYFPLCEGVDDLLSGCLKGCPNERDAAAMALKETKLENYIMNFNTEAFLELAFQEGI